MEKISTKMSATIIGYTTDNSDRLPFGFGYGCDSLGRSNYPLDEAITKTCRELLEKGIVEISKPKSIHFVERNGTTTVKWKDGTITTVKCGEDDVFDKEKGVALCFMKKRMGNNGSFNEILKEWCY